MWNIGEYSLGALMGSVSPGGVFMLTLTTLHKHTARDAGGWSQHHLRKYSLIGIFPIKPPGTCIYSNNVAYGETRIPQN